MQALRWAGSLFVDWMSSKYHFSLQLTELCTIVAKLNREQDHAIRVAPILPFPHRRHVYSEPILLRSQAPYRVKGGVNRTEGHVIPDE